MSTSEITHSNWLGQQQGSHVVSGSKRSNLATVGTTHIVCESTQTLTPPSGGLQGCSSQTDGGVGASVVGTGVIGEKVVGADIVGDGDSGDAVTGAGVAGATVIGDGVGTVDGLGRGNIVGTCVGTGSVGGGHLPHVCTMISGAFCVRSLNERCNRKLTFRLTPNSRNSCTNSFVTHSVKEPVFRVIHTRTPL